MLNLILFINRHIYVTAIIVFITVIMSNNLQFIYSTLSLILEFTGVNNNLLLLNDLNSFSYSVVNDSIMLFNNSESSSNNEISLDIIFSNNDKSELVSVVPTTDKEEIGETKEIESTSSSKKKLRWYHYTVIILVPILIYITWFISTAEDNLPSSEGIESTEVSGQTPLDTGDSEAQFKQRWTWAMRIRMILTVVKRMFFD